MITPNEAVTAYSKELVATVLDILEATGNSERTCKMVRQAIYDKKDIMLFKIQNDIKGNAKNDYQKNTTSNYKKSTEKNGNR